MKTETAINLKSDRNAQALSLTGCNMRTIRKLNTMGRPTAEEIRGMGYDYKKHGQTYMQALHMIRYLCAGRNQAQAEAEMYKHNHRGCPSAWLGGDYNKGVYRNLIRDYGSLADTDYTRGCIARESAEKRRTREESEKRAKYLQSIIVSPADWIAKTLAWNNPRMDLLLADGRRISTTRNESVEWDSSGKSHWPTSRSVSYCTKLVRADGEALPASEQKSVSHDARGNWRARVLVELGLLDKKTTESKNNMHLRLTPSCTAHDSHKLSDGTQIGERLLCGTRVDYYARTADSTLAFHAATVADAVAGLQRKKIHAEAAQCGELLTAEVAKSRWGFCLPGIREFAEATGLDTSGEYVTEEIKAVITPEIRTRFGRDLAIAGI